MKLVSEYNLLLVENFLLAQGEIIKGTIDNGQKIEFEQTDNHPTIDLTISSVEFVDHLADKFANVGLIVKVEKSDDLTDLLNYRIKGESSAGYQHPELVNKCASSL